jgi:hypothetical protein
MCLIWEKKYAEHAKIIWDSVFSKQHAEYANMQDMGLKTPYVKYALLSLLVY